MREKKGLYIIINKVLPGLSRLLPVLVISLLFIQFLCVPALAQKVQYYDGYNVISYDDGSKDIINGAFNFLRWDGVWRPNEELNISNGSWPYLYSGNATIADFRVDDTTLTIPRTNTQFKLKPNSISYNIVYSKSELLGKETSINLTDAFIYFPYDLKSRKPKTEYKDKYNIKYGNFHFKAGMEHIAVHDDTPRNYIEDGKVFQDVTYLFPPDYEFKIDNGEIRLVFNKNALNKLKGNVIIEIRTWNIIDTNHWGGNVTFSQTTNVKATGNVELKQIVTDYALYTRFDEGSGNIIHNENILNRPLGDLLGVVGSGTYTTGKYGQAIHFNGVDNKVLFNDHPDFRLPDDFTISYYIKLTSDVNNADSDITRKGSTASTNPNSWWKIELTNNLMHGSIEKNSATADESYDTADRRDGLWHFVAYTRGGTTCSLIVDGATITSNSCPTNAVNNALLSIGSKDTYVQTSGLDFTHGTIDEVRIYNRKLSASELTSIRNNAHYTAGTVTRDLVSIIQAGEEIKELGCYGTWDSSITKVDIMASADNSIWNTIKSNATPNVNYAVNSGYNYKYSRCSLSTIDSSNTPIIQSIRANIGLKSAGFNGTNAPILSSVSISSNNANPAKAKVGNIVNVTFTANQTLLTTPTATIAGQSATVTSTGGNSYNASFTMTDSQANGAVAFTIDFTGAEGNPGTQVTEVTDSSSVTFDKSALALSSVSISSNNANPSKAKVGNVVNVTFTANETLLTTPTVTIAGHSVTITSTGGNSYNATYTMVSSDTEGAVSFTINFTDAAGNPGTKVTAVTDTSSVTFDKSAPMLSSVSISSNKANPALAIVGDNITITLTANESLLSDPVVTIESHAATVTNSRGYSYNAAYNMVSNDTEGAVSFTINFTDAAGNDGTQVTLTTDESSVTFYKTSPTVINPGNNSINRTGHVNVTVILDKIGTAQYLNWNGVNYSMTPNTSQPEGTIFYKTMTGLLSGNYSLKVYANDSNGLVNVSETRIVVVNRTIISTTIGEVINHTTHIVNSSIEIISPSKNVTVTILNGTNASVGGAALTSISVDSLAQVNSTFDPGSNDNLIGENLSIGPEGAIFSPDIQMRFNYTEAMLTEAGITASELRIKFYNTTTNTWVVQTPYTLNETGKYITANVSHFSIFALMGKTTSTTGGGDGRITGGGGSGGGGGGGKSDENSTNIELIEKYDVNILKDVLTSIRFKDPKNPIMFVNITGKNSLGVITTSVEVLKDTSTVVKVPPDGLVYKNANIWVGTSGMATPKNIKEALIEFKVDNSWMSANGVVAKDIVLVKWDGSSWTNLETTVSSKDDTNTYLEGKTYSFSQFAITVVKSSGTSSQVTIQNGTSTLQKVEETTTPQKKSTPGFDIILAVASISALLGRKRR